MYFETSTRRFSVFQYVKQIIELGYRVIMMIAVYLICDRYESNGETCNRPVMTGKVLIR